jgi:HSP20 family protein
MTLMRRTYDPLRTSIEQIFDDLATRSGNGVTQLLPPMDVRETDRGYVVELDLPGVNPDDIDVMIEGRTLTVRGRIDETTEQANGDYLLRERRRGTFMRAVTLPGMVEVDKVASRYQNGQLIIELPKASSAQARRIEVAAASGSDANGSGGRSNDQSGQSGQSGQASGSTATGARDGRQSQGARETQQSSQPTPSTQRS